MVPRCFLFHFSWLICFSYHYALMWWRKVAQFGHRSDFTKVLLPTSLLQFNFSFLSYEWGKQRKCPLRILHLHVLPHLLLFPMPQVPHHEHTDMCSLTSTMLFWKMLISCQYLKNTRLHKRICHFNLWKIINWSNTEYTFMWEQAELSGNRPFLKEHELLRVVTVPSCKKAQTSHMESP